MTARLPRLILALIGLCVWLLLCDRLLAQEPAPSPASAPCDPSVRACLSSQHSLVIATVTSPGVPSRIIPGARSEHELLWLKIRLGIRFDLWGQPGQDAKSLDYKTASTAEAHVLLTWDVGHVARIRFGPAVGVGAAMVLGEERPTFPKSVTAGVGLRVSFPRGWAACIAGQNQALRGVAGTCAWDVATKAGGHLANVGMVAIGRRLEQTAIPDDPAPRMSSVSSYVLSSGVAARF